MKKQFSFIAAATILFALQTDTNKRTEGVPVKVTVGVRDRR